VVAVVFALNGFAFATLFSRIPAVRDTLDLSPAGTGLLLLALSAGTLTALPLSGAVVHRIGPAPAVLAGTVTAVAGLVVVAAGLWAAATPTTAVGLVLYGAGSSTWDVAMNVEGAAVERRLGRTLMPRFHAGFSIGAITGALAGAASARWQVDVSPQLMLVGPACLVGAAVAVRAFLPASEPDRSAPARTLAAWREPRTLLIGLLVCSFALVEGVANDWLALALVDGHGTSQTVGAIGLGVFVAAMTIGRLGGGAVLDRYGRAPVLRATAVLAALGVGTVVAADPLPLVIVGAVLWGLGASLGFPVGMSAGADEQDRAASRVAVVSSIGYTAFLAGPPLVGFLAEAVGILRGLLVVVAAAGVGGLVAFATSPPARRLS